MTSAGQRERVVGLLTGDRAALLMGQPFLAVLAMQLPIVPVVDARLRTAGTDGQQLFVSAPFIESLSAHERRFLLAHVVWHCALLHPWRRAERAAPFWDAAIDHEVNAILTELVPMPEDATLVEDATGSSAEQIYQRLVSNANLPDRGHLADVHIRRAPAEQPPVPSGAALDPAFAPHVDRDAERLWAERVLAAASQVERSGGRLPGAVERLVRRLRRPELPWPDLLRQFVVRCVGDERVWLPPSRRHVHRGLYLPSRHAPLLRIAVALDTSASTQALQPALLAELHGIVASYGRYEIRLVQGDARVQSSRLYTNQDPLPLDTLRLRGFGGTDFRPIFAHLAEQDAPPAALVFLTDGHGDAPADPPDFPVLWALTARGRPPAGWGQVVRLGRMAA